MALNFQLISKTTKEATSLSEIDDLICENVLHVTPHHKFYGGNEDGCFNWFDTIGFQIASGLTLEDGTTSVRNHYKNSEIWKEELPIIEKIIDYLQENFTTKNWVSVGK